MQELGINILFEGRNFLRLLEGLAVTIQVSLISVCLSIVLGLFMGMVMRIKNRVVQVICRVYLETVRIVPQLVLLFLVYFGLSKSLGINLSGFWASVFVFSFWGIAETGDLVRGALESIPRHQYETAAALALNKWQVYVYVIIPQTMRHLLPQTINLVTRMIKTTSLIVLIGVVEVVKVGQQIIEAARLTTPSAPLWIYGVIFLLYFIICYPISKWAAHLEKHWNS